MPSINKNFLCRFNWFLTDNKQIRCYLRAVQFKEQKFFLVNSYFYNTIQVSFESSFNILLKVKTILL